MTKESKDKPDLRAEPLRPYWLHGEPVPGRPMTEKEEVQRIRRGVYFRTEMMTNMPAKKVRALPKKVRGLADALGEATPILRLEAVSELVRSWRRNLEALGMKDLKLDSSVLFASEGPTNFDDTTMAFVKALASTADHLAETEVGSAAKYEVRQWAINQLAQLYQYLTDNRPKLASEDRAENGGDFGEFLLDHADAVGLSEKGLVRAARRLQDDRQGFWAEADPPLARCRQKSTARFFLKRKKRAVTGREL